MVEDIGEPAEVRQEIKVYGFSSAILLILLRRGCYDVEVGVLSGRWGDEALAVRTGNPPDRRMCGLSLC